MNKALLIGVNRYQLIGNDLHGCLADCNRVYDTLINTQYGLFQFQPEEVRYLFDENATKDNILFHLDWLTKDRDPDDKTLIYYSGHGSRVPDTSGSEADGYTEILCPTDMHKYWNNPLKDRDIEQYALQLPRNGRTIIIFDCCHSGTATMSRYAHIPNFFQQGDRRRVRYMPCPPEFGGEAMNIMTNNLGIGKRDAKIETTNYHIDEDIPYVYYSGCRDSEYSNEIGINGESSGVLTYVLMNLIKQNPHASNRDIFMGVESWFNRDYQWLDQHPQMHTNSYTYRMPVLA